MRILRIRFLEFVKNPRDLIAMIEPQEREPLEELVSHLRALLFYVYDARVGIAKVPNCTVSD